MGFPRSAAPPAALLAAAVALTGLLAGPVPLFAQSFVPMLRMDTPVPVPPGGIALGDLDDDGRPDLVVANPTQATFSVQRGDGAGGFGARTSYATGLGPRAIALADLNGDGRRDVVVANSASATVTVWLGLPQAGFGARADYATGPVPTSIAVADFNLDSKPDLAVSNLGSASVSILLGTGTGAFGAKTDFVTDSSPRQLAAADLNEDGRPDVLTANGDGYSMSWLRGIGDGTFDPRVDTQLFEEARTLLVTDVNHDGHEDAVVGLRNSDFQVHAGDGAGGLPFTDGITSNQGIPVAADWNSDGNLDFAAAGDSTAELLHIVTGNGSTSFVTQVGIPMGGVARGAAVADLDGNGAPDIVIATEVQNKVTALLGARAPLGPSNAIAAPFGAGGVGLARVNADAHLDLLYSIYNLDSVYVRAGDGTGAFGPATSFATGDGPNDFSFVDVSGDANPDLVVSTEVAISVLLGNGAGAFGPKTDYPTVLSPWTLLVADVSGDGKRDVLVSNWSGEGVALRLGNGNGTFGSASTIATGPGSQPTGMALARMDADTTLDLVTANWGSGTVAILPGNGAGGFGAPVLTAAGGQPASIAVGDLDGDGDNDVVAGQNGGAIGAYALLGNGTGGVTSVSPVTLGTGVYKLALRDVNLDGRLDLIAVTLFGQNTSVLLGDGTGHFGPAIQHPNPPDASALAVDDIDANGRLDVVVGNSVEDLTIRLGKAPTRTTVSANPNPVVHGGALTLTATVTAVAPATGPVADGMVRFHDGTTLIGSAPVLNGTATLNTFAAFPWFRTYRATYGGGDRWFGSLSPPFESMSFITAVDVPSSPPAGTLSLAGVLPNPAPRAPLVVHFSLASDAAARLELFDLRGRRLAGLQVGSRGPGAHAASLDPDTPVPAGVYFVRLTQDGRVRTARAVVLASTP